MKNQSFYVYRNLNEKTEYLADFPSKDDALLFMEQKASREINPKVTGFCVRDYDMRIYAEMEL
jgi:hypothetical protein